MGKELVKAISRARGLELVGAIDTKHIGEDAGEVAGIAPLELPICSALDLPLVLTSVAQDTERSGVLVDFSAPQGATETFKQAIAFGVRPVVGTTGLSDKQINDMMDFCDMATMGAVVSPSFSIGQALVQQAAQSAVFHYTNVEVNETLRNDEETPSRSAIISANSISGLGRMYNQPKDDFNPLENCKGEIIGDGVMVNSSCSDDLTSSHEIIFGGLGEQLSFKHTVIDYKAYIPGVILAIRRVVNLKTFVFGIDKLL
eukprot:CAMPEP_0196570740 /NCGR_PEP_ID=MMETSP1081-20130531/893_1 /TAXON_ID=36882 /ORGANISM="Pyramimonas amylifera, Strain CCMP720" /LENGTH=257 /DNA_ID=CAMNT_0041887349 /DNA_START=244 /DNA_END=1017 /DNA_ORIENTATION=+